MWYKLILNNTRQHFLLHTLTHPWNHPLFVFPLLWLSFLLQCFGLYPCFMVCEPFIIMVHYIFPSCCISYQMFTVITSHINRILWTKKFWFVVDVRVRWVLLNIWSDITYLWEWMKPFICILVLINIVIQNFNLSSKLDNVGELNSPQKFDENNAISDWDMIMYFDCQSSHLSNAYFQVYKLF